MSTDKGWIRYDITVTQFDLFGEQVECQEYTVYDYELAEQTLDMLDTITSVANDEAGEHKRYGTRHGLSYGLGSRLTTSLLNGSYAHELGRFE